TARDLSAAENADLCAGCVLCCTYVTIEVDAPRQPWEYDQWIWMLHHQGIEMYVERPERWFVHLATRCRQLDHSGRCAIHGRHPVLCRDYDPRSCERRAPLSDVRAWFKSAEQLEAWVQEHRPVHWERLQQFRAKAPDGPPRAHGRGTRSLVQIEASAPARDPRTATRPGLDRAVRSARSPGIRRASVAGSDRRT